MPREVRGSGATDGGAKSFVGDAEQSARDLRRNHALRGDGTRNATFCGALERGERTDSETEGPRVHAALTKSAADFFCQEGQLVRPDAARHSQDEHPVVEPHGARAVGDAGTHGVAPHLRRNRRPHPGKPILARARENGFERFGRRHRRARSFHSQSCPLGVDSRSITFEIRPSDAELTISAPTGARRA
ncbi:MAG: hypothetical protein WBY94_01210 [Polyangiaceae bacterium]